MTDAKINIAIAEITGEEHGLVCHSHGLVSYDRAIPHEWQCVQVFKCPWCKSDLQQIGPNYTGDLNAMHEAETLLTFDQQVEFSSFLGRLTASHLPASRAAWMDFKLAHATARQRAEAFLRVFGNWKEDA